MTQGARQFENRVAIVAGASGGINLGIAKHLGELGAKIVLISRSEERIAAAADHLRSQDLTAIGMACDVRDSENLVLVMENVAERCGLIDILVSGAAGNFFSDAKNISAKGFKTIVDIDLIGTYNVISAAYQFLKKPGGVIVNISAPQGQRPMRQQAHVCAAKAGVDMLTKCLALEWGAEGLRVNAVSPGPVADTEGFKRLAANEQMKQRVQGALALPRLGEKRDIAQAVAWLCSDEASFVTGAVISCDGGMALGNLYAPDQNSTA